MAKRVVCSVDEVDKALQEHARGWRLVAVVKIRKSPPGWVMRPVFLRELYFERDLE